MGPTAASCLSPPKRLPTPAAITSSVNTPAQRSGAAGMAWLPPGPEATGTTPQRSSRWRTWWVSFTERTVRTPVPDAATRVMPQ